MANSKKKKTTKKVVTKKPVKKITPKKANAKKAVIKKTAVKKTVSKKAVVKKTVVKKAAKKVNAKKVAKKTITKKTTQSVVASKPAKPIKTPQINVDYSKAITPLADRLVIRVVQGERVTAGGLIIPEMVNTALGHLKGEVLAVGMGAKNKKGSLRPLDVQKGDIVLFAEYAGSKIIFNSEELQIIRESDVMGIVQK